jgi:hypothetical protein
MLHNSAAKIQQLFEMTKSFFIFLHFCPKFDIYAEKNSFFTCGKSQLQGIGDVLPDDVRRRSD